MKPAEIKFTQIRTVGCLKRFLLSTKQSPEKFAKEVRLSHMTIRRWLKRPDDTLLPKKYFPLLDQVSGGNPIEAIEGAQKLGLGGFSFEEIISELEESGRKFKNLPKLEQDLKLKLRQKGINQVLKGYVEAVFQGATSKLSSKKVRAISIGALLYLLNPFDLIPDALPVIGYLDDLAILSIAVYFATKGGSIAIKTLPVDLNCDKLATTASRIKQ